MAAQQAVESPLIEVKIEGARGVLFSVAGGYDMSMSEIQEAAEVITGAVSPDANIIFGASIRPELEDEIIVTVVATGFDSEYYSGGEPIANVEPEPEPVSEPVSSPLSEHKTTTEAKDFATPPRANMWDSIKSEPEPAAPTASDEDEMDVPPSLRERFRKKKKE